MARVCAEPHCPDIATDKRHCDKHKRIPWKGSRKQTPGGPRQRRRKRVFGRDRGLCQPCKKQGRITPATQMDHVIPISQGGVDEDANCQAICSDCHATKSQQEARAGRTITQP